MQISSKYFTYNDQDYFYIQVVDGVETIKDCQVFQSQVKALAGNGRRILLDFSQCRFVTGSSIGFLVSVIDYIRKSGGEVAIVATQGEIRMLLDLVGTSGLIPIVADPPRRKEDFESVFKMMVGKSDN